MLLLFLCPSVTYPFVIESGVPFVIFQRKHWFTIVNHADYQQFQRQFTFHNRNNPNVISISKCEFNFVYRFPCIVYIVEIHLCIRTSHNCIL